MRRIIRIPADDMIPSVDAVLKAQGVPVRVPLQVRMIRLAKQSISIYRDLCFPVGILTDVSKIDFKTVYHGEGYNEKQSPLDRIYVSSDSLALFAVTIGEDVCREITRLFEANDFAVGSMLDAAASEGSEMAARALESYYRKHLREVGRLATPPSTMRFSPGYCGWHITAQKKLFEFLQPAEIGIELGETFMMRPLKSISGVIVAGSKEIFEFDDAFPFCSQCDTHSCRDRIRMISEQ